MKTYHCEDCRITAWDIFLQWMMVIFILLPMIAVYKVIEFITGDDGYE